MFLQQEEGVKLKSRQLKKSKQEVKEITPNFRFREESLLLQ
jgi:hypothetical protein